MVHRLCKSAASDEWRESTPNRSSRKNVKVACSLGNTSQFARLTRCGGICQERKIMLFGSPKYILSDNDLKFACQAVQDFAHRFNIQWKSTSTYNPQGNGVVESMAGTLKKALHKVTRIEFKEWDAPLENVLYGYRRRRNQMEWHDSRNCSESTLSSRLNRLVQSRKKSIG